MPRDLMALQACCRVGDRRCHLVGLLLIADVSVTIYVTILKIWYWRQIAKGISQVGINYDMEGNFLSWIGKLIPFQPD
jgi:hypothetical protein